MKKHELIIGIITISLLLILTSSSVNGITYQATYERWDGEIRPVNEITNPYNGDFPYKVIDLGGSYKIERLNNTFILPKKTWMNYDFSIHKISPIITINSLNQLSNIGVSYNSSVSYIPISNLIGVKTDKIIRFAKNWFWDENFIAYDSLSPNKTYMNRSRGSFKVINNELRFYTYNDFFVNAVYPVTLRFDSFTYQANASAVQSCWANTVCTQSITNGTDSGLGIINYNASSGISRTGLMGEFLFNDGSANDSSGNSNNGTINGGTTRRNTIFGTGYEFDGNGDWINVVDNGNLSFTDNFTVVFRLNVTDFLNDKDIVRKVSGSAYNYHIFTKSGGIRFQLYDGTNNPSATVTYTTTNTWNQYALVRNRADDNLYVYFNCVLNQTVADTITGSINNSADLLISNSGASGANFSVDGPRFYNRPLPSTELCNLFNNSYPISGNITTTNLGATNNTVRAVFDTLPGGTSFNFWQNSSGSWSNICTACANNTNYVWTPASGQQIRVELIGVSNSTPQLNSFVTDIENIPPNIDFINQIPPDYNLNNLDNFDNISIKYSITDNAEVNNSLVNITTWFSADNGSSLSPIIHIVNGINGNHIHNYTDISGDNYTFFLKDPHIIRGTMRTDPDIWNNGINDFNTSIYKNLDIRAMVSNVTILPDSTYIIEYPIDVFNSNKDLNIYLGNYTGCFEIGVRVENSNNWVLLNSINNTQPYGFGDVHTSTFLIDSNNEFNGLKITSDMCIQTRADNNQLNPITWQGSNTPILNRSWNTTNGGLSLVEITDYTPRFIIHPALLNTSSFCYQVNATDINDNSNSSTIRCDLYGVGLTPLNPILNFINPLNGATVNGTININSSIIDADNSGFISLIRLFYSNNTERVIINNSGNENKTNFIFNTSNVADSSYYILWSITSGNGGLDSASHNITIMNNPPDILQIPLINENQSFEGVNISILYLILLIMGFCLISVLYSNDLFIVVFFSSVYLILWTTIIYTETFYRVILVSETVFSEGDCLSVIVSGVCDITRFNSTRALNYGREIIALSTYVKSALLFLGVLGLSKIAMIRKKRKNELLNIEEFRKMRE